MGRFAGHHDHRNRHARALPHGSDFTNLGEDAEPLGVSCLEADETPDDELAAWIRDHMPDAIFCIGWNRLLRSEILE